MKNCPNYKHPEYKRLVTYFNGDEKQALRVFIAQGYALPEVPDLQEIKRDLKFRETNLSELSKAMLLKRLSIYNTKHNTSHRVKLTRVSPTTYKAKLALNFMPKYKPIAYNQSTVKTVNSINSDVEVETVLSPSDIIIRDGNEYIANGEVYPTYEDAYNSVYNESDDSYFQLSGDNTSSIKELNDFLEEFLGGFGVKVDRIDNFKKRFGIDGIGVADILNKTIYVAKGKESSTTLPEEAAHFIVEMMGENHPLYKAMSSVIEETAEYSQVVDEYGKVYNNDKVKLRKEAIGKVLSKYFLKRNENKEALPIKTQSIFERVVNWFKKFFGRINNEPLQDRLNSIFGTVANQVFDGTIENISKDRLTSEEMYFQLTDALSHINKAIKDLEAHAKILERRAISPEYEKQAETTKANVEIIKERLEKEGIKKGITTLLSHAVTNELKLLRDTVDKIDNSPNEINVTSTLVNQLQDIIRLYTEIDNDIQMALDEDEDLRMWAREYEPLFSEIRSDLSRGKAKVEKLMRQRIRTIIEEIKDPNSTYDITELLDSKEGDVSGLVTYIAPLHSASDEVLRMVYKVVQDIYMENHHLTVNEGNELLDYQLALEKSGIKDLSVFHEKDDNGKKTGYLLSEFKWGEYNKAVEETKASIINGLNKMGMTLESYGDFNRDDLNKAQLEFYKSEWALFSKMYMKNGKPNPAPNPEFNKLMRNPAAKNYYNALFKLHEAAKERLPKIYRSTAYYYLVPQIEKDVMQVLMGSRDTLSKNLREKMAETWKFSSSDQETADNRSAVETISSSGSHRIVPIYFVKPLENKDLLSDDFTSMYAHFTEMSRNFRGLTNRMDDLLLIQQAMGERRVLKGNKDTEGVLTNAYKMYDAFLKQHVFKEYQKVEVTVAGKKYNLTKIIKNVLGYVRGKNLFGAMFTVGSGYVKASIDSTIEDVAGIITNKESKLWAEKIFDQNILHLMGNINKRNKTTKMEVFFQNAGVFGEINTLFKRMDSQYRISRMTKDQLVYGLYELAGVRTKGKLALSVYDNYRLVDGKFITRLQYKQQIIKKHGEKAWNDYKKDWAKYREKSLYNAFEVNRNQWNVKKEFKQYVTPQLINTVNGIIEQRSATIDGRLHNLEKGGIFNNLAGQAVMMHRGWLISGAVERFKKGGINYITGQYEEGYYRTLTNVLGDIIKSHGKNLLHARAMWSRLEPWQKRNMLRLSADIAFTILAYTMYSIAQSLAEGSDDDDDWYLQAMAYQTTRILLEQKAFMGIQEPISILNSPSAGLNLIDDVRSFGEAFIHNDIIEYGPYKGKTHLEKSMWRIFYLKNLYELQYPATKNKYVKTQIF